MGIEQAVDRAEAILIADLGSMITLINTEQSNGYEAPPPAMITLFPRPEGRAEVLAATPSITLEGRTTTVDHSEEEYIHLIHTLWVWAFVVEVDQTHLHRAMMRYAEGLRRLLAQRRLWGGGWDSVTVLNTMPTNVFQADHELMQGCRVEVQVRELAVEAML